MTPANAKIHAIYRYPVKGLSPEPLARTTLAVQDTLPGDRLYAIENGPSGFDPAAPRHQPKQRYLMLMRNERLAQLRTRFDDSSHTLAVEAQGREVARGDLRTPAGRAVIERFFAVFCADELRGAPKVRANVYVTGWPAWHEFDLVGREIALGASARLKIIKPIVRCAATNVDPDTGMRDLSIPDTLLRSFGHADCGVYGEVVEAGGIVRGDDVGS